MPLRSYTVDAGEYPWMWEQCAVSGSVPLGRTLSAMAPIDETRMLLFGGLNFEMSELLDDAHILNTGAHVKMCF